MAKQCIVRDTASYNKLGTEVHQDLEVIPEPVDPCVILKTRILSSHSRLIKPQISAFPTPIQTMRLKNIRLSNISEVGHNEWAVYVCICRNGLSTFFKTSFSNFFFLQKYKSCLQKPEGLERDLGPIQQY